MPLAPCRSSENHRDPGTPGIPTSLRGPRPRRSSLSTASDIETHSQLLLSGAIGVSRRAFDFSSAFSPNKVCEPDLRDPGIRSRCHAPKPSPIRPMFPKPAANIDDSMPIKRLQAITYDFRCHAPARGTPVLRLRGSGPAGRYTRKCVGPSGLTNCLISNACRCGSCGSQLG